MKISNNQLSEIIKRAFIHGLVCASFFEDHLTKKEQLDKVKEVLADCLLVLEKERNNGNSTG